MKNPFTRDAVRYCTTAVLDIAMAAYDVFRSESNGYELCAFGAIVGGLFWLTGFSLLTVALVFAFCVAAPPLVLALWLFLVLTAYGLYP